MEDKNPQIFVEQTALVEELLTKKVLWVDPTLITGGQPEEGERQWWAISPALVGWLRECGQLVIDDVFGTWWGRRYDPEVRPETELEELAPTWT